MPNLLSHPFRLTPNGKIATVDQDSDTYLAERIAIILQTQPGERVLAVDFGIEDPAFDEIDQAELEFQLEMFELPVVIDEIVETSTADGKIEYQVRFHRDESIREDEEDEEE